MTPRSLLLPLALAAAALAAPAGAQIVETPVPFDSLGRVHAVTPSLAARLGLAPPGFPVEGSYTEVRLYRLGAGPEHVLVVHRAGGALERRPLSPDAQLALRAAVDGGMQAAARPVGDTREDVISESARGAFIRNQLAAAATIYGGSLAELADGERAGAAVYLLSVGGAFFTAATVARRINVSKAQNHLATDAALRGSIMARGLAYSLGLDPDEARECAPDPITGYCDYDYGQDENDGEEDVLAASILVGGLGGSIAAFRYGRGLTDSEAKASTFGSTAAALTTLGALGTAGVFNDGRSRGTRRAAVAGIVGAGLVGYPLGLAYPRRASYRVSAGDIGTLGTAGTIGVLAALTPLAESDDASGNVVAAVMTAGFVGGLVVGDRAFVRPYDFTDGEALLVNLGAAAGAVMASGVLVLAEPESAVLALGMITAGAALGAAATVNLVEPARAGTVRVSARPGAPQGPARRGEAPRLSFAPEAAALAAAGVRGRHSILRVTF